MTTIMIFTVFFTTACIMPFVTFRIKLFTITIIVDWMIEVRFRDLEFPSTFVTAYQLINYQRVQEFKDTFHWIQPLTFRVI
jgi:hypothetical protein